MMRGQIRISTQGMEKLLHLRAGLSIVAADYDAESETIRLHLHGTELRDARCREVSIIYRLTDLQEDLS